MIELYQYPRALGVMNASPFCMKVEVFLKLARLPYHVDDRSGPMHMPKGKLPALRDAGVLVCDSADIIAHLQRRYAKRLPEPLRLPETGAQLALRRMFEEHLYFAALWLRWMDDEGFAKTGPALLARVPGPLRGLLARLVRWKLRRDLKGQGMGRHSPAEILDRARADLEAAEQMLGDGPFFGGAQPSALDCCVYAFIANLCTSAIDQPLRHYLKARPAWIAYRQRMHQLLAD